MSKISKDIIFKPKISLINLMKGHSTFCYLRYHYLKENPNTYFQKIDKLENQSSFIKALNSLLIILLTIFIYLSLRTCYESYRFFRKPTLKSNTDIQIRNNRLRIELIAFNKALYY